MNQDKINSLAKECSSDWDSRVESHPFVWMSDVTNSIERFWESGAEDFQTLCGDYLSSNASNMTALDLGCGTGRLLREASRHFSRVLGIDLSGKALAKAKELLPQECAVECVHISSNDFSEIGEDSVDFTFSYGVLGVLTPVLLLNTLVGVNRFSQKGADAVLQLYLGNESFSDEKDSLAVRCYDAARFESACNALGFELLSTKELIHPRGDISIREEGLIASIAHLKKSTKPQIQSMEALAILCSEPESHSEQSWRGSEIEYRLAITRAQEFIDSKRYQEALELFKFAQKSFLDADPDIAEVVKRLEELFE